MSDLPKKQLKVLLNFFHILIALFIISGFIVLYLKFPQGFFQNHLTNILDEISVIFITYILLDMFYLNRDKQIKEDLTKLIDTNEKVIESIQKEGFPVEKFFHPTYDIPKDILDKSETILLCGVTLREVLEKYKDNFSNLIGQKKRIKIIISEPSDHILELWSRNHILKGNYSELKKLFTDSIHNLNALASLNKDLFEIRTLPFIPTQGMFIVEQKSQKFMWVQIYAQPFEDNK